ncbi:SAWADEE HOMEODOMAIN-like 2 [Spatholobus suberectus]|nr:SAWADEE HOMEODOMAIN-like 2 [Spatholobus suberectus]
MFGRRKYDTEGEIMRDPSELEFEARSSKDGAWYDVEAFLAHRFLSTGEAVSYQTVSKRPGCTVGSN